VTARPIVGAAAAIAMSAIVFAGSAQFAATAVLADGGSPAAALQTRGTTRFAANQPAV